MSCASVKAVTLLIHIAILALSPRSKASCLQDITPVEDIRQNPKCDREIAVYGYLRGTKLKGQARVHIAGVGDTTVSALSTAFSSGCLRMLSNLV